ncbi:MAG: hypothetical protein CM1200mP33_1300 [Chloroflexota bacterium]|nr:MAG: hypothetical protein CM1200mP33_1300 [Chloroflexota bacterium]
MLKMLRVKQKNSEMIGSQMKNSEEIFKALQNMIENEIMDQIAPSLGIIIPPEQIEKFLLEMFLCHLQ